MDLVDERISLDRWLAPWLRYQHIARYEWLLPLVKDRNVIEAACGTGYGSEIILKGQPQRIDCFDLSREAILSARETCSTEGLHFAIADVTRLPVADDFYDTFVSLETIEHVDNDRAFLAEVVRVLKPGGKFICSTPNRTITNPGTSIGDQPFNQYHLREYTLAELESLLSLYFKSICFYCQTERSLLYSKLINAIGTASPRLAVRLHQVRKVLGIPLESFEKHYPKQMSVKGEPEVLIALCTS